MSAFDVPFIKPQLPGEADLAADLHTIVEANWYSNFGPYERRFAREIGAYLDEGGDGLSAATFSSATAGLMAALATELASAPSGGLVIVPSFTFVAGPAAIRWAGQLPLFIDIDPVTLQPSLDDARAALAHYGEHVVGILLGNTLGVGNPAIREWEAFARAAGLPLVIDSAAGLGSRYADGSKLGSAGDCEVFSFHVTKPFAIGEGGAVVSRDRALIERMRAFSNFGLQGATGATMLGLNGKLQELNAAIGLKQLLRFDAVVASRQRTLSALRTALEPEGLRFLPGIESSSVGSATAVAASAELRDAMLAALHARGVEARVYYAPAVHRQPYFAHELRWGGLAATDDTVARVISLPVHHAMAEHDVATIVDAVREVTTRERV